MGRDDYETRMMFEVVGSEKLHVFEEFAARPKDSLCLTDLKRMTDLGPTVLEPILDDLEARDVIHKVGERDGEALYRLHTADDRVRVLAQLTNQFTLNVAEAESEAHR